MTQRASRGSPLLPVTVLSGFLGAGKTTLLKHILRTAGDKRRPMRIAVIVNDMGEINLDASEIKHSKLIQEEATMVEMHNGCICCTLRGDLLKTVAALSKEKTFDYLIIESTGISEPLPVAQTFVMDIDDGDDHHNEGEDEEGKKSNKKKGRKKMKPQVMPEPEEPEQSEKKSLSNFARLDTLVTVVDALNLFDVLSSLETLAEPNSCMMVGNTGITQDSEPQGSESEGAIDDRSIAQLMLDQIEFANVIVLSKAHLLGVEAGTSFSRADPSAKQSAKRQKREKSIMMQPHQPSSVDGSNEAAVERVAALIRKLNPKAHLIVPKQPKFGDVRVTDFVNTHLFDMDEAQESAGWIAELKKESEGGGHTPETEEYGIGSVLFRSQERPFHPQRLRAIFEGFGNYKLTVEAGSAGAGGGKGNKKGHGEGVFNGVVRAKGHLWIASANAYPVDIHIAGRLLDMAGNGTPWLAAVPREEWNEEDSENAAELLRDGKWHKDNGDRESEAVFIGVHLDKKKILSALQAALLTDAEFEGGVEAWREWPDPFFGGDLFDLSQEDEDEDVMMCAMEEEKVDEIETFASKGRTNGHKRKAGAGKKDGKKGKEQKKKKA